jgi:hypothetical protein
LAVDPPVEVEPVFGTPEVEHRLLLVLGTPPAVTGCGPEPVGVVVISVQVTFVPELIERKPVPSAFTT